MDRITFFKSVSGMQYPDMVVNFFDHFIALKQIVEDKGSVTVDNSDQISITVTISFHNKMDRDMALEMIRPEQIMIYGRPIRISVDVLTGNQIKIVLS